MPKTATCLGRGRSLTGLLPCRARQPHIAARRLLWGAPGLPGVEAAVVEWPQAICDTGSWLPFRSSASPAPGPFLTAAPLRPACSRCPELAPQPPPGLRSGSGGALPAEAPPAAWRSAASCLSAGAQPRGARAWRAWKTRASSPGARRSLEVRPGPRRGRGRTCTLRSPFCTPAAACPSPSWGVPEHGDPTRGQAARWAPWGRHRLLQDGPRGGRQRPRPPRVRLKTLVTAAGRRARPDTRGGVELRGGSAGFRLCVLSKSEKRATGRAMGAEGA